jgi:DNA-binding response OmpR family regulator
MREKKRILIVEDDYLIAMMLAETLEAAGWQVVGPIGRLAEAVDTAATEGIDVAVLDINLGGWAVYPVAQVLAARNVPFLFLTGYGTEIVQRPYCERPRLGKPIKAAELIGTVTRLLAPAAGA